MCSVVHSVTEETDPMAVVPIVQVVQTRGIGTEDRDSVLR